MNLKLKNIGIIKKADIKLDGLTVIAGENDSGKSTVGKVIYSFLKTIIKMSKREGDSPTGGWDVSEFDRYIFKLFNSQISRDGSIFVNYDNIDFSVEIQGDRCKSFEYEENYTNFESSLNKPLLIDSPYIWNVLPSLNAIRNFEAHKGEIDFEVNEIIKDLYFALTTKLKKTEKIVEIDIESIIKGAFAKDNLGNFTFKKDNQSIQLINTAMGIKYFGILQVLSENNHLYKGQMLILDEPEVHLHPKWQLKLAEVIVSLVKEGVEILVNSHSPYMIEALERYSEQYDIKDKTNFYLAHKNTIEKIEDSNSRTLSEIFEKLSEPFDVFEKMQRDRL